MPPKTRQHVYDRVAAATAIARTTTTPRCTMQTTSANTSHNQAAQPTPGQKPQANDALSHNMGEMLVCRIHPLCGTDAHRITAEELRRDWDIVVQKLDLRTGQAEHGQAFIQPIPPDEIRRWLDELRPWDADCAEPHDFDLPDSYDPYYDPRVGESVSFGIRRVAYNYIGKYYIYEKGTIIENKTNWLPCNPGVKHLSSSNSNIHHWDVTQMFHQCDPATIRKHRLHSAIPPSSELPHLSCFLHDDEILESDGGLSTAELITIMVCALRQATNPMYTHASVIPIVVFSCSGRQVRIVQGCIDFRHYQFDVRCSDILDFNEGGMRRTKENEQRFYTFLGWILGNPVGNIKEPQHPGSRR